MKSGDQLLLSLLIICQIAGSGGCKDPGETGCTSTVDADADGWTLCDDCDDTDPAVHPEATDCVNGLDDDCDGEVDPAGAPAPGTWHPDGDGDGYGDYASTVQACEQPADAVDDATDCDDSEHEVHPEADELCNERDDDCDGVVDEDAVDVGTWTTDEDGDGWGVEGTEVIACEQPDLTAAQDGDCDDADPEAHPEASPGCDGRDMDCDGAIDNDADLDGYSDDACGGDDCDDGDATVYPNAPELCEDGVVNDCTSTVTEAVGVCMEDLSLVDSAALIEGGSEDENAGWSVAGGTDINGDGWLDVFVGAPGWGSDDLGVNVGYAGLVYGPVSGSLALTASDVTVRGEVGGGQGDSVGMAVCFPGDVNADGAQDLLVSSGDASGRNFGAAHIFYGPVNGALLISEADARLVGEPPLGDLGEALAGAGDVNGDGHADLIMGDEHLYTSALRGVAYLVHGPVTGERSLAEADAIIEGASDGDHAGCAVASAGDVNGDGLDDLLVGAYLHDDPSGAGTNHGMACLLLSPVSGDLTLDDADARLVGAGPGDWAGFALATAGDLDGDGLADILIGAPQAESPSVAAYGSAYAVLRQPTGEVDLSTAEIEIVGANLGDQAGSAVTSAGDVDGDGTLDLLIGAPWVRQASVVTGAAYIVLAPEPGSYDLSNPDVRLLGDADMGYGGYAGFAVAGAGDMDGDGRAEVLVGAPNTHTRGLSSGTAYLVSIPVLY